jgi:hypothetical protein
MGNPCRNHLGGALSLLLLLSGCPGHLEDPSLINGGSDAGGSAVTVTIYPDAAPAPPDAAPAVSARPDAALGPDAAPAARPDAPLASDVRVAPDAAAPDAARASDAASGPDGALPTGPEPVTACPMADAVATMILGQLCNKCHSAAMLAGGLDLASPNVKARLINVPSRGCMGKPLVVAGATVGGVFFDKLAGPVPGCGSQMPFGGPYLGPMELKCLKDWIKPSP